MGTSDTKPEPEYPKLPVTEGTLAEGMSSIHKGWKNAFSGVPYYEMDRV